MSPNGQAHDPGQALVHYYTRTRRLGALLILGALLVASVVFVLIALNQPEVPPPDFNKLGVHLLLDDGRSAWPLEQWPAHLDAAARLAPGGTVVQLVRLDDLNPERWQLFMDLAAERDLRPVLRLATTYDQEADHWRIPPADDATDPTRYHGLGQRYAAFVGALDWPTTPTVIVLNEPNNGVEWGGRPDPAAYARLLVDVAAALREAAPEVLILNAALDLYAPHTGDQPFNDGRHHIDAASFMDAMRAEEPEVFSVVDIWNSHSYPPGPFSAPPWEQRYQFDALPGVTLNHPTPPPGIHNRGVNGYEWELWQLNRYGLPAPPVIITETGYRHSADGAYPQYPPPEDAAALMDMTLRGNPGRYRGSPRTGWTPLLSDPRIMAVTPFALGGRPSEWGHTNWLRLNEAGALLGTYALYDVVAGYGGAGNAPTPD